MENLLKLNIADVTAHPNFSHLPETNHIPILSDQGIGQLFQNKRLKFTETVRARMSWKIFRKVDALQKLEHNWDGNGADVPNGQTFFNVLRFLHRMPVDVLEQLNEEDIKLTPYGTVVLDFQNQNKDLISVEIGDTKIGYFTDFKSGKNFRSSGIQIGINDIPKEIIPVFNIFMA